MIDEVANLVERPVVLVGRFDDDFLALPPEVLTVVMKKHQRYLPIWSPEGDLMPSFVVVANGPIDEEVVRAGNEAVLRARYADAAFFFERDRVRPLVDFLSALESLVFEERAGSMLDRSDRVERLAGWLADTVDLSEDERATLARAAHLAKADLTTDMVVEMSSLAGQMRRIYAREQGEPPEVSEAVFEHTLPRFAGDQLPSSRVGALLAIADRADALAALFAVGAHPTGSADPYGMRRAALGLAQIAAAPDVGIDLQELFAAAADLQKVPMPDGGVEAILEFIDRRMEQRLVDEGHPVDLIRAALGLSRRPDLAVATLHELEALRDSEAFRTVATMQRRCARIARTVEPGGVDAGLLAEPAEKALWEAYQPVATAMPAEASLTEFVERVEPLASVVDQFFDDVLVMTEDQAVRANRLRLVAAIRDLGGHLLAWDELAGI